MFAFACSLRFLLGWSPRWLVASAGAAMLAISAKPPLALVFIPLIGAEAVVLVRQAVSARRAVTTRPQPEPLRSGPLRPIAAVAAVAIVVVLLAVGVLYATMQNNAQMTSGIPNQKDSIVHLIERQDPVDEHMRASLRSDGAPTCLPLDRPVAVEQIFTLEEQLTRSCPKSNMVRGALRLVVHGLPAQPSRQDAADARRSPSLLVGRRPQSAGGDGRGPSGVLGHLGERLGYERPGSHVQPRLGPAGVRGTPSTSPFWP